jgi:hypothetical protein
MTIGEILDKLYVCKERNARYLFSPYMSKRKKWGHKKHCRNTHRHVHRILQGYSLFLTNAIEPARILPATKNAKYGLPEPNASDDSPATIGPAVHPVPKRAL